MSNNRNMEPQCVFTIVAGNYLPHARVLMRSLATHSPGIKRVVILCDRVSGNNQVHSDVDDELFELVQIESLGIKDFPCMAFSYSLIELCTAVKPYCFKYLFDQGATEVIYLDPDIKTYASLKVAFDLLGANNIVLTPHLSNPVDDCGRPGEVDILKAGIYNLGFLAVNASRESMRFIAWWSKRLRSFCIAAPAEGLYVDQRWIDLVPGMFEGVYISKHPGLNLAYWNLNDRVISTDGSKVLSNNEALVFVHYSGLDPIKPSFSRHQDRYEIDTLPAPLRQLTRSYIKELIDNGADSMDNNSYAYSRLFSGTSVSDTVKTVYLEFSSELPIDIVVTDDPNFESKLVHLLNKPVESPFDSGNTTTLTRIAYRIYKSREDLQQRYPDVFSRHSTAYLNWLLLANSNQNLLPEGCRDCIKTALADLKAFSAAHSSLALRIYHKIPMFRQLMLRFTSEQTRKRLLSMVDKNPEQ